MLYMLSQWQIQGGELRGWGPPFGPNMNWIKQRQTANSVWVKLEKYKFSQLGKIV